MTMEERNVRVKSVEDDGRYFTLEWTTENGERLSGDFKLFCGRCAPEAAYEQFYKVTAASPKAIGNNYRDFGACAI